MTEHEEVIIDGDSTEDEDEDEVTIITPEARKRRRHSNILLVQDEDEGDEETKMETVTAPPSSSSTAPRRQQQLLLNNNGMALQPMTLRTPTVTRPAQRRMHQLSLSSAVAPRRQQEEDAKETKENDVRIIPSPFPTSVGSSRRKSRRLAIEDSDEEIGKLSNGQQDPNDEEVEIANEEVSASRRSSRLYHQHKRRPHGSARKLDYFVLDNCLENLQSLGPHYTGRDHESEEEVDSSEESPRLKRRRQSVREQNYRETEDAEVGDDVDDFICGDDEVEYMNDDEEAVISVESSDDEMQDDRPEEVTAMLAVGRSREVHEWFDIYMEYLEDCVVDVTFEATMRRRRSKAKHQLYEQAINRIERTLCSCRDTVRSGVAWPEKMVDALRHASLFCSSQVSAERDCDACNRRQHVATYHVELGGYACDATKLYSSDWMRRLKKAAEEATSVHISFEMGSVCHARTLAYWQLLHAKQFWCILIDAKRKESFDNTGRIPDAYREEFVKKEFGRYKRLVGLVDKFAEDSKRGIQYMPNAWKAITRRNVTSDFLPLASHVSPDEYSKSRRGALDAFVGESEEEGTEDEEDLLEQMEKKKRAATCGDNDGDQATGEEKGVEDMELISSRLTPHSKSQMPCSKTKKELRLSSAAEKMEEPQPQDDERTSEKDIDDLMCLICNTNPRNAGVVHGLYLHVYCCYACAKRQHRQKSGCMVCNRPTDRVLRLLPLTKEARKAIQNQQKEKE